MGKLGIRLEGGGNIPYFNVLKKIKVGGGDIFKGF